MDNIRLYKIEKLLEALTAKVDAIHRQLQEGNVVRTGSGNIDDDCYEEAKKIVIETREASASVLQIKLQIGYARAARMLDILEQEGVIGPHKGAEPRDILI